VQGVIDGTNTVFTLGVIFSRAMVFKNGQGMTLNVDCVCSGRTVLFLPGRVPQPGDTITVLAA
jgi:hypothetical protein